VFVCVRHLLKFVVFPAPLTLSEPRILLVEWYLFVSAAFAAATLLCLNTPEMERTLLFLQTELAPGPPLF